MSKTEKELQELKGKVEALNMELEALTDEELDQVAGGRKKGALRLPIGKAIAQAKKIITTQ